MQLLIKKVIFFSYILGIVLGSYQIAAALSEEERRTLRMFFKDQDLIVTATRHPKLPSQVAENITVITKKDIEAMNAHTVAEVLSRVTGLFVDFNRDFGATSLLHIQGSEPRHVLVLLDGISWNFLIEGAAETNTIPVGIIERIEVVKGPASSAWGSSLGGVINVITKSTGINRDHAGSISASYGKGNSVDYRNQLFGELGTIGYYLYLGYQDSDGLRDSRYFENTNIYAKFNLPFSQNSNFKLSLGYSSPKQKLRDAPTSDVTSKANQQTFFLTSSLETTRSKGLGLKMSFYIFNHEARQRNEALGLGLNGSMGDLILENVIVEDTYGGSFQLIRQINEHLVVFGSDFNHGRMIQTRNAGLFFQNFGVPATSRIQPEVNELAIYLNDTVTYGRWTFTPGIRYDYNTISGSFISPSLGITYEFDESMILRSSLSRGFTSPPLGFTSGSGLFVAPNPSLKPEKVISYQLGLESTLRSHFQIQTTLFYHDLKNEIKLIPFGAGPPSFNDIFMNSGTVKRQGFEAKITTRPVFHTTVTAGTTYVHIDPAKSSGINNLYTVDIGIKYDNQKSLRAQLFGHYIFWDYDQSILTDYSDFIWDINLMKNFQLSEGKDIEFFFSIHNIFNGSQYTNDENRNPFRWAEAGVRFKYK